MLNNNKKVFRMPLLVMATVCLLITGCNKQPAGSSEKEPEYNIVRPEFTPDYDNYGVSGQPSGVNVTYYNGIYSRGFSWLTDENTTGTELYLVQSDKGEAADFSSAQVINGTSMLCTYDKSGNITAEGLATAKGSGNTGEVKVMSHKVHVENLEKGKAYSYKIGSDAGYYYGAFIVEKEKANSITAVHVSDAQTKELDKHYVWRNTIAKAVDTAGKDLDMFLYNGDQFDQNNSSGNDKEPFRLFRYSKAIDVIQDYKFNVAYMSSSGNHEPSSPYSHYLMSDINYAGYDYKGAYYSYDYDYAHFVVLNTNTVNDEQINWLKEDLDNASNAKWKVVTMHISPYTTGDHSNKSENQSILEKLTPIFSEKHVDLVLQAHDHTYNKTMPYRWDAAGYTTSDDNLDEVVNLNPETETVENVKYDKNPNGTYYVTTGAAGHRCGSVESDGIWAEVVKDGNQIKGLNPSKTFTTNKYKNICGTLTQSNQYEPYTISSYTSAQNYQVGDPATGNVNACMFGILNMTETTLSYHVYTTNDKKTVDGKIEYDLDSVKLFDTLDILKA